MQISYDISAALAQGAGIGRYTRELACALRRLPPDDAPALQLVHTRQPLTRLPAALADRPRHALPLTDRQYRLLLWSGLPLLPAWRAPLEATDLFHGTDILAPRLRCPTVVTVYDLTPQRFPHLHTRLNRIFLRWAIPAMSRRATAVIAISASTKRDLVMLSGIDPTKVHVTLLGVDHTRFAPQTPRQAAAALAPLGIHPPYILAVGTLEPRKNLPTLLRAYATLPADTPPLVLTGGKGWGDDDLARLITALDLRQRVRFTGYVPDDLLPALYAAADVFVYPSLYEGFGLPVLEALACGAPVLTSNTSSLPEVVGDAGVMVDPTDAPGLAAALGRLHTSPGERQTLREAGPLRARRFSWDACAAATLAVYRQVLS